MYKKQRTTNCDNQTSSLDLSTIEPPLFVSRQKGIACRQKHDLDKLDHQINPIRIIFPKNTYTLSSGFFLGLFGKSIRQIGNRKRFLAHYIFTGPTHIISKINKFTHAALRNKKPLLHK